VGDDTIQAETLLQLAADRRVRQSKGFREVAEELTGEKLAALDAKQRERAPRRAAAGKRFFPKHAARLGKKETEHVSRALLRLGIDTAIPCDDEEALRFVDWGVPLASGTPEKSDPLDPNAGVGKVDLLALRHDERLVAATFRFLPPDATRGTTGDTPLRALLEALAASAIIAANIEDLRKEAAERFGVEPAAATPAVALIGTPRYWELCRKREAQKGARWIREMERLATEVEEQLNIPVYYLGMKLRGDPWLESDDEGPRLPHSPGIDTAWEPRAGVVKPKASTRSRTVAAVDEPVEADMSRPVRDYATTEAYDPGDRIQHPTLGMGVVQAVAGPAKVRVRFDEDERVLVHNRAGA
jgi:hypothetical protein